MCIYSCHGLKEAMSRKASRRRQININVVCIIKCVKSRLFDRQGGKVVVNRTVVVDTD